MKLLLLLCLVPMFCFAQSGLEIIKTSAEKIKNLKNIRYTIYSENSYQKIAADVTIERGHDMPVFEVGKIKLIGLAVDEQGSSQVKFSYNGRSFDFMDLKTNQLTKLDSPDYRKLGRTGLMNYTMLVLAPYWQKEPFGELLKNLTHAEIIGDTSIYTNPCHKIRLSIEVNSELKGKQKFESIWFIDKKTYMIAGRESKIERNFLKTISLNTSLAEDYFDLSEGTEIKKITGKEPLYDGLLSIGTKAPDFSLTSSSNKIIQLNKLKGKVILLDFWGTWCVPCLKAMPDMQAIHEQFKDQPFEVLGVSVETEHKADPVGYMKQKGYTYTCLLEGAKITRDYKVVIFPSIYLIDKSGIIIHAEYGSGREDFKEDLVKKIKDALKN